MRIAMVIAHSKLTAQGQICAPLTPMCWRDSCATAVEMLLNHSARSTGILASLKALRNCDPDKDHYITLRHIARTKSAPNCLRSSGAG